MKGAVKLTLPPEKTTLKKSSLIRVKVCLEATTEKKPCHLIVIDNIYLMVTMKK